MRPAALPLLLVSAALLAAGGCATPGSGVEPSSLTAFKAGPMIEGTAKGPKLLPEAVVQLLDPSDDYLRVGGKAITTTTDRSGTFRFQGAFPRDVPVIVAAALDGNRRVVAFTVPGDGTTRVSLSPASTLVTEFLRAAARADGKSLAAYDRAQLADLVATTQTLLDAGDLATPSLAIAAIGEVTRAYAVAVGNDVGGLGDRWAALLGRRVIALVTVMGDGVAGAGGDGEQGVRAGLDRPRGAIADSAGHLFVADEGNDRVRRLDARAGIASTFAGSGRSAFGGDGGPAGEAHLAGPRAVALDAAGNLYVADTRNRRIRRVDAQTGLIETIAGNPAPDGVGGWFSMHGGDGAAAKLARFYAPRSLAFDPAGDLYVADSDPDSDCHVVRKIDLATGLISTAVGVAGAEGGFAGDGGRPEAARLNFPNQIAFDPQGRLLIADTLNHCIRRVDLQAGSIATIAGIGGQPGADSDGEPAGQTRLDAPYGVAAAPDGRLFIAERGAARIRTQEPDGTLRTLAGGGTDPRDGEARGVSLGQPHDLFVEASGDLLLADARGARLRRLVLRHGL